MSLATMTIAAHIRTEPDPPGIGPLLVRLGVPLALSASVVILCTWMLAAPAAKLSPSGALLLVMSVAVLAGLMLWPGAVSGSGVPEVWLGTWSAACVGIGALAAAALLDSRIDWGQLLSTTLVGFLVLLACLSCVTLVAAIPKRRNAAEVREFEPARWTVAALLALAAAAPLWAGPFAEGNLARWPQAVEATVAVSPLTHLAVAAGNDLLRNDWMYAHSSLGSLQFSYPGLPGILTTYLVLCTALLAAGRVLRARRRHGAHDTLGPALEPA
jgi:hypothetical protein